MSRESQIASLTPKPLMLADTAELDALVELLVRKGAIAKEELLNKIRDIKHRLLGQGKQGSA